MAKNLLFNCSYSEIWVHPENWKTLTSQKSLKLDWYVECKFYDPLFKEKYPKGFPFRKKLNRFKTLDERKAVIQTWLKEIPILIEEKGFNPITKKFMIEPLKEVRPELDSICPETPFLIALELAYQNIDVAKSSKDDIRLILVHIKKSAIELRYDEICISEIKRKHFRFIIDNLERKDGKFSAHKFNKYRTYLSILYNELLDYEAVDSNIIKDIRKKAAIKNIRETLNEEERRKVNDHLKAHHPSFWLFMVIFFHSGGRITELMSVKISDVDLINQKYKVLVKKGKQYTWVERIIKDIALPYWQKSLFGGKKTDFVFSVGLMPGEKQIRTDQIRRRWKTHVKEKLNITADFYSLKHLNLDETVAQLSMNDAMRMGNFKSTKMLEQHYAVGEKDRQFDRLKTLNNKFA